MAFWIWFYQFKFIIIRYEFWMTDLDGVIIRWKFVYHLWISSFLLNKNARTRKFLVDFFIHSLLTAVLPHFCTFSYMESHVLFGVRIICKNLLCARNRSSDVNYKKLISLSRVVCSMLHILIFKFTSSIFTCIFLGISQYWRFIISPNNHSHYNFISNWV